MSRDQRLMNASWFKPHLERLLNDRVKTLASWRQQTPALSGRTKNFENWLLVELIDRLWRSGKVDELRTNGHFDGKRVKASDVEGLSGRKGSAIHLSADISARLKRTGRIVSAEIKTGFARGVIIEDLLIVRHYNTRTVSDQAELAWVALLPASDSEERAAIKSFEKTYAKLQQEGQDFAFTRSDIRPWLITVSAFPRP